tara:strand:- start:3802 stop:5283 length:1482 start_codon:yes stop_codon:yes gene_type:complete
MKVLVALLILVLLSIGVGCSNEDLESTTEPISIKNKKADVSSSVLNNTPVKSSSNAASDKLTSEKNNEPTMVDTPTPIVLSNLPSAAVGDVIEKLKSRWLEGYERRSDLDISMDLSITGTDITQSLPLKMQGKVDRQSNFEGTLDSWDSNGHQSVQLIALDGSAYYKFRDGSFWSEMPDPDTLLTPKSIASIVINHLDDGTYINAEIMGGIQSYHLKGKVESRKFGTVIKALEGSAGLYDVDLWVGIDSSRLVNFVAVGDLVGGPDLKGPNGEKVRVESSIRYASWDSGDEVVIARPDLPPTPNKLQWDNPPKLTIDLQKDYQAVIKIYNGGEILIDLLEDEAPVTVNNFVFLAEQGFYDGITFHRVIPGFMAQTGDPTGTGRGGPGYSFDNEFHTSARHDSAGAVSMANAGMRNGGGTNGSQFFITYRDTSRLDGLLPNGDEKDCEIPGTSCHSVFGKVLKGMEVVGNITPRDPSQNGPPGDIIESVSIITN